MRGKAGKHDGADAAEADSGSATEPAQEGERAESNGSAQQSTKSTAEAHEESAQPPLASAGSTEDQHTALQPHKPQPTAMNGNSEEKGSSGPRSQKKEEALEESRGEQGKEGYQFSKGAYFIGKCVWGKVKSYPSPHVLAEDIAGLHLSGSTYHPLRVTAGLRVPTCACIAFFCLAVSMPQEPLQTSGVLKRVEALPRCA